MSSSLAGKKAIITGATGGIGNALYARLLLEGVDCFLIDKKIDRGSGLSVDFSNEKETEDFCNKLSILCPKVDYLFNVAGVGIYKKIEELEYKEFEDSYKINVFAPFLFTKSLIPSFQKSDNPLIFNVGSIMGTTPIEDRVAYCSSKFALRGMSLSLSKELKEKKIDVCLLTLGSVMDNFGTGGIEERKRLEKLGKKYLEVGQVVDKIVQIVKLNKRGFEYKL